MGNYVLKQAGIDDYDFVYSVKKATLKCYIEKIWGWDEEYQRKDFHECYNALNNKIIMNNRDKIGIVETIEDSKEVHIVELAILHSYQGMGVGTDILKEIIKNSQLKGKKVNIGCFKINEQAKKLYLRLGFKVVEETKTHYILKF